MESNRTGLRVDDHIFSIIDLYENDLKNQLELKGESPLFKAINALSKRHWSPEHSKPIPYYTVTDFEEWLHRKAKKFYLRKLNNTVFEFISFNRFDDMRHPIRHKIFEFFKYKRKHDANLTHYISLDATLTKLRGLDFYIQKMAILFNFLAKKNILYGTLEGLIIVPHNRSLNTNTVSFGLFVGVMIKSKSGRFNHLDILNKIVGFEVFVYEGKSIVDFDWDQINKLK